MRVSRFLKRKRVQTQITSRLSLAGAEGLESSAREFRSGHWNKQILDMMGFAKSELSFGIIQNADHIPSHFDTLQRISKYLYLAEKTTKSSVIGVSLPFLLYKTQYTKLFYFQNIFDLVLLFFALLHLFIYRINYSYIHKE